MKYILMLISVAALVVLFVAPTLHAMGIGSQQTSQAGILIGTIGWFGSAILWMRPKHN